MLDHGGRRETGLESTFRGSRLRVFWTDVMVPNRVGFPRRFLATREKDSR